MACDLDKLAAFRESAIDERVRAQEERRDEAERTARTTRDELWRIDRDERYARTDDERLEYAEQTRRQAVLLAEEEAEATERARRAAAWAEELDDCRREFGEAAFRVRQILNGPGNRYAESLGMTVMRLERALQTYYDTDTYVSGKQR